MALSHIKYFINQLDGAVALSHIKYFVNQTDGDSEKNTIIGIYSQWSTKLTKKITNCRFMTENVKLKERIFCKPTVLRQFYNFTHNKINHTFYKLLLILLY